MNIDLNSDYFNKPTFVGSGGYYKGNKNYQCANFGMGIVSYVLKAKCTYYTSLGETKKSCDYQMFKRAGYGNAKDWWNDTLWDKGSTPKPFSIMVYGSNWGGGYGHIRFVQEVKNDTLIICGGNEDNRGGVIFDKEIKKPQIKEKEFLGYIYLPIESEDKLKELVEKFIEDYKSL